MKDEQLRFNYAKLRGAIREKMGTLANFAEAIGISNTSLSDKLQNKVAFTQREIELTRQAFDSSPEEIAQFFFNNEYGNPDNNERR